MPIGGRPLLEYWLQTLHIEGVNEVIVNTCYHSEVVRKFLAREHFAKWVSTVNEPKLMGTAGTLKANVDFFRDHTTILIHADNWCQCDFGDFMNYHLYARPKHCLITMMTFDTDLPESCGIVEINDQGVVTAFHEKVANPPGKRANAAVYILQPEVIAWLAEQDNLNDFSTEVLPKYIDRIATWHNAGTHRDIGTLPALLAAQNDPLPQHYWPGDDDWQKDFDFLISENQPLNLKRKL